MVADLLAMKIERESLNFYENIRLAIAPIAAGSARQRHTKAAKVDFLVEVATQLESHW